MLATFFSRPPRPEPEGRPSNVHEALASQAGDTLIEVVISAMLVGLIVVAVLTGFNETNKVSQDERAHDQASVLAAQSDEQLRSDPAPALNALVAASHEYTQTVGGTTYTITQSAQFVNGSGETAGCANSKNETETSKYVDVTSSVKWSALGKVRAPVTQSSVITPPDGSGLEVDVTNLGNPETPVSGVTVKVEGVSTTTGSKGCVIYTGIPATTTNVEAFKLGYVTPNGEHKVIAKEVSIAPNIITHYHINLNAGGTITATFTHKGAAAKGDTFVAFNNKMGVNPEFEVGSTKFSFNAEEEYEALTGTTTEGYAEKATTPVKSPSYPTGDLFPFTSAWTVYAGDCTENNPLKDGVSPGEAIVPAGGNATATVPTSYVTLNLYQGASGTTPVSTSQEVKITNLSCTKLVPNNAIKADYEHRQTTNTEGHLEVPYQPFGEFEICVAYNNTSSGVHSLYKYPPYKNTTETGTTLPSIYVGGSSSGWTSTNTGTTTSKC